MKLLVFTPCEKVLQDPNAGFSLINIFNDIKIQLLPNAEAPSDAVIPKEWVIFSKWALNAEDEGKNFSAHLTIHWPNGKVWAKQSLTAAQPTKNPLVFVVLLQGFPFGQNGKLRVVHSLERDGETLPPHELEIAVTVSKDMTIPRQDAESS